MTWFLVDDDMSTHRKIVRAGNAAVGLWTRAGSWSCRYLTDGFIPDDIITTLGTTRQATKLVDVGLWIRDDERGGYQFHEWEPRQRQATKKGAEKRRAADAERQRRKRERETEVARKVQPPPEKAVQKPGNQPPPVDTQEIPDQQVNDHCHAVTHAPVTPPSHRDLTRAGSYTDTGSTNSPIPSSSPTSRARERAADLDRNAITTPALNLIRNWHTTLNNRYPTDTLNALARTTTRLLADNYPETLITQALNRWNQRTDIGAGLLPNLVSDIIKEQAGAGATLPAGAPARVGTGSKRVDKALGFLAPNDPLRAELGLPGTGTPAEAVEGDSGAFRPFLIEGAKTA